MNKFMLNLVKFAEKYATWQSYATDRQTTELVCAAANLGIIEVSPISRQFRLKSKKKAQEYIAARS